MKIFLLSFLLLLPVVGFSQTDDETLIRDMIAKTVAAYQRRSLDGMEDVIEKTSLASERLAMQAQGEGEPLPIRSCTILNVRIIDDHAMARLYCERVDLRTGQLVAGYSLNHWDFRLIKTGGRWWAQGMDGVEYNFSYKLLAAKNDVERRRLLAGEPDLDVGEAIIHLAYRFYSSGDYEQASNALDLGEWIALEHNDMRLRSRVELNRGIALFQRGKYREALASYAESLKHCREKDDPDGVARAATEIGRLYFEQGNYYLASDYFLQAVRELQNQPEEKNRVTLSLAYNFIGDCYFVQGNDNEALKYYQQSSTLSSKYNLIGGPGLESRMRIAAVYARMGDRARAISILEKLILLGPFDGAIDVYCSVYIILSGSYLEVADFAQATSTANQAVSLALKLKNAGLIGQANTALGRALMAAGNPDEAESAFRIAIEATEKQRLEVAGNEDSFQLFFSNKSAPYSGLVEIMIAKGRVDEALLLAERSKARVLTEALTGQRPDLEAVMTTAERDAESKSRTQLTDLNRQLATEKAAFPSSPALIAKFEAQVNAARNEYEDLQARIVAEHPKLDLARGPSGAVSSKDIDGVLGAESNIAVEYVLTEKKAFAFVLSKAERTKVFQLPIDATRLRVDAMRYRDSIASRDLGFGSQSRLLYKNLIGPIDAELRGKTNITIIPDGELWELPFATLIDTRGQYLIERFAISYGQSLKSLSLMNEAKPKYPQYSLLAFGNPALSSQTVSRTRTQYRGERLDPLPDAENEVRQIAKYYGTSGKALIGANATEDIWKAQAKDYRFLHLATHGVLNSARPMYSHLLLSFDGGSGREDGVLEAWEIMRGTLNAEMVVMSACESGRGRISPGEGIIGLSWAFFVAGVPTTVVSQWNVESRSTAMLMKSFYGYLNQRQSKSKALQQAMLAILRNPATKHPFYWAGFVVVGKSR